MSNKHPQRPSKQQKTQGNLLLPVVDTFEEEDDDDEVTSSSTSLESSEDELHTWQYTLARAQRATSEGDTTPSEEEDEHESDEEDETTSSDSDESDENGVSTGQPSITLPSTSRLTTSAAQTSELQSRLQTFLPLLQQANTELQGSRPGILEDVPDNAEQYIEMNLSLGVLTEQTDSDKELKVPGAQGADDHIDDDGDADIMMPIVGNSNKASKRKIEEVE